MDKEKKTCVVIDLDDTLYDYGSCHKAGIKAMSQLMCQQLDISMHESINIYENGRKSLKNRLDKVAASHSRLLYLREGFNLKGINVNPSSLIDFEARYWTNFLFAMEIRPGVTDFLATLKYNKIPTFLITDLLDQIQLRKVLRLNLGDSFDGIITSELAGGDKITGKPFELMAQMLKNVSIDHLVFIGDSKQDFPNEYLTRKFLKNFKGTVQYFSIKSVSKSDVKVQKFRSFKELEKKFIGIDKL